MYGGFLKLKVRAGRKQELVDFLVDDGRTSLKTEPGTRRFEIWIDKNDPDALWLFEAYDDEAAFEAHKQGRHFKEWASTVRERCVETVTPVMGGFANSIWAIEQDR